MTTSSTTTITTTTTTTTTNNNNSNNNNYNYNYKIKERNIQKRMHPKQELSIYKRNVQMGKWSLTACGVLETETQRTAPLKPKFCNIKHDSNFTFELTESSVAVREDSATMNEADCQSDQPPLPGEEAALNGRSDSGENRWQVRRSEAWQCCLPSPVNKLPPPCWFHTRTRASPQTVRVVTLHVVARKGFYSLLLIKSFTLLWMHIVPSCHGI